VDGTGAAARRADVGVREGRIAAVGELSGWSAEVTLEAAGLVVAPGFIDMHTHSDLALLINPRAESKVRQGVTTEVIGQCGFSPAPALRGAKDAIRVLFGEWAEEVDWTWGGFGDYVEALRGKGTSVNVVPVVGHGVLRAGVMGQERRAAGRSEMAEMEALVRAAMEEGAFGVSTGLTYVPGMFADTEELVAVARPAAEAGGVYFSHIRGERETLLEAVGEAVEVGRRTGASVEISHLKAEGRGNWGKTAAALDAIERAREEGVEVSFDAYPYTAWNTSLAQLLPAWAREGGAEAIVGRLRDSAVRARVREELAAEAAADAGRWERRLLASVETDANRPLQGKTIAEIAGARGEAAEEVVMELLVEERAQAGMVGFGMCEEDVRRVLSHPAGVVGSDSAAQAPYGVLGKSHPHPRTYGTFARVLGHYVREEKLFSLEEGVAKMTGRPAAKLGLSDRGRIAPGMAADIVVFDAEMVAERATYEAPHQYAAGVRYVMVNGVVGRSIGGGWRGGCWGGGEVGGGWGTCPPSPRPPLRSALSYGECASRGEGHPPPSILPPPRGLRQPGRVLGSCGTRSRLIRGRGVLL